MGRIWAGLAILALVAMVPAEARLVTGVAAAIFLGIVAWWGWLVSAMRIQLPRLPGVKLLEVLLVLTLIFVATITVRTTSSEWRIHGNELGYLLNSGVVARLSLTETGRISLWNPLIGTGEPLLESPFSFVLNPLMSLPVIWFGEIQGPKLAIAGHALLIGLGGWALAWIVGLRAPGRLLLALLLGGSGSMTGAIGEGFYQMALSQAYVPWVIAGLWGTLYRDTRWPVGLLAVAASLMLFAGTYWYVLPTMIASLAIAIPALTEDPRRVPRLFLAAAWTLGLGAVRVLPQVANLGYIIHPDAELPTVGWQFLEVVARFFVPQTDGIEFFHHYTVPLGFALLVLCWGCIQFLGRFRSPHGKPCVYITGCLLWKLVVPATCLLVLFTIWADDSALLTHLLYDTVPGVQRWRFTPRMQAAATPWLALLVAVGFDGAIRAFSAQGWRLATASFVLVGCVAAGDVLYNWERVTSVTPVEAITDDMTAYLRVNNPNGVVAVQSFGFFDYWNLYEARIRARFGNPDYRPGTLPAEVMLDVPPPYAIAFDDPFVASYYEQISVNYFVSAADLPGYEKVPAPPTVEPRLWGLWENPGAPAYAFTVDTSSLEETTPASYLHQLDRIIVMPRGAGDLLVVQETAYPGWQVWIDGVRAPLVPVSGLLGVRLPNSEVSQVVFAYRPRTLHIGAAITLIVAVAIAAYLLRADQWLEKARHGLRDVSG